MLPTGNIYGTSTYANEQQMYQQTNAQWQPTLNPPITYQMIPSSSTQQMPTNYYVPQAQQIITPMQQQIPTPLYNPVNEGYTSQQLLRMSSTSEEEDNTNIENQNKWQVIKSTKRRKTNKNQQSTNESNIETTNRFSVLSNTNNGNPSEISKPPPIFVHGVLNYNEMIKTITDVAENEQYYTKSLANNIIKINCSTPETYRKLVKHFLDNNIFHHTYQLKEERAYRVVIKYLHHSTNVDDIKEELAKLGHNVRNIINAQHRISKEPLNLFFADIEPAENNKQIYNVRTLQNRIVQIEPPHIIKRSIVQCTRCQQYGHTKKYCNKPYICVKCGGSHNTKDCKKTKETAARCALCGGNHPANYKGCEHYRNLTKNNNRKNNQSLPTPPVNTNIYQNNLQHNNIPQHMSYADATKISTSQDGATANILTKFLEEFKGLFNQLIQQNSMVLNMLTMLINKLK